MAAVKNGRREKAMYGRWKYTFQNIVYITDSSSRIEITSWVQPIEIHPVPVRSEDHELHEQAAYARRSDPSTCTSHIVFVVDQSG